MNTIWLALTTVKGLGPAKIQTIYNHFPNLTMEELKQAETINQLKTIIKNKAIIEQLCTPGFLESQIKKAEDSIRYHEENSIQVIAISDSNYPALLKRIKNPPIAIYCKGNTDLLNSFKTIAVVGTRTPTITGMKMAKRISRIFSEKGYIIVSGLAIGIDTEAHTETLAAEGKTIAVLASGLDAISPKENRFLADEIIEKNGLLISEYPLNSQAFRGAFVQRDRIQSGLSLAICPVQTDIEGGTQHTISFAKQQERLLFCPKPLEQVSATRGIQKLIDEGIFAIGNSKDIDLIEAELRSRLSLYEKST